MQPRLAIAFTVLAAASAGAQPSARRPVTTADSILVARLDSAIHNRHDGGADASIAVAIMRGRDTLLLRGYGVADRESGRAATPNTIYEIGSLTKQITAAAIMRLVEQGKLDLDADIARYVPEFPVQGRHVTVRSLLNHTSGIHNYTNGQEWKRHWAEDVSPSTIVDWVARDTFDFAPGTRMAYSNTGYVLLGMIIENVSRKPYATYLDQELFAPLGLRQTHYCASHPTDTLVAKGYTTRNRQPVRAEYLSLTIPFAAGAVCSSVADFVAWERAFHTGRVVNAASYLRMMTPDTIATGKRLNYGFGMSIGLLGGHPAAMYGGEVNGFTSAQIYLVASRASA
jgi:D-alanyl-D-alanine carboxypeptidase